MTKLADSPYGDLYYVNGELLNKGTVADPVAYRGGTRSGGGLVKWSGDRIRPDGVHEELVLDQYKQNETTTALAGEVTRHLRAPGQSGADTLIETVRFDGIVYEVPIIAKKGILGAGGSSSRFYSDDNRYAFVVQGDDGGKIVQYDRRGTTDESQWTAVAQFRGTPV